jgi:hypothetical protein
LLGRTSQSGQALETAKETWARLTTMANEGTWTLRAAGLSAGFAVTVLSFFNFFGHLLSFAPFAAVLDIYICAAGLVCTLLEFKERFFTQVWSIIKT